MTRAKLIQEIKTKRSFLCVGLDTDLKKIPAHLLETEDPIFEFNKAIIDATKNFWCVFEYYSRSILRETLLDHELLLEKAQKRQQRKKGRNRKFEGKRKAESRVNYHKVHDGASEEIGTKTMPD